MLALWKQKCKVKERNKNPAEDFYQDVKNVNILEDVTRVGV